MSAAPVTADMETRIAQYVGLRDKIKELDDQHKAKMKPYREMLEKLNNMLLANLLTVGGNSVATDAGTAYVTTKKSATLADTAAFRRFVIGGELWDLIDMKANAPAVEAFIEEHKSPPPGVNFTTHNEVGVRRPNSK